MLSICCLISFASIWGKNSAQTTRQASFMKALNSAWESFAKLIDFGNLFHDCEVPGLELDHVGHIVPMGAHCVPDTATERPEEAKLL